jgi:hypothetical protein
VEHTPAGVDETSNQSPQIHEGIATVNNEQISVATAEHLEGGTRVVAPTTTFTLEEEKRIIQLLDWHIMSLIVLLYSLSVLDSSNLDNARIAGMDKGLSFRS